MDCENFLISECFQHKLENFALLEKFSKFYRNKLDPDLFYSSADPHQIKCILSTGIF